MHWAKRIALSAVLGAASGALLAGLFVPPLIVWFQTPGVGGAMCNCADVARETAKLFSAAQMFASLAGAIAGVSLVEGFRRMRRRRAMGAPAPSKPTEPTEPTAPAQQ